jgi:hypothetical protein
MNSPPLECLASLSCLDPRQEAVSPLPDIVVWLEGRALEGPHLQRGEESNGGE